MDQSQGALTLCVPVKDAQIMRKYLEEEKLWDDSRKLQRQGSLVAIPVHNHPSIWSTLAKKFPDAEIKNLHLPSSAKNTWRNEAQKLKECVLSLLKDCNLSESLLLEVPKKWERHGDLVILPSSAFTSFQWYQLGDDLWQRVATALACRRLARHSCVANDGFRTPQVSMLFGHDGQVVHVDNGIKYSFDVTKCMFSSGNVTEKLRVASWDCSNETVVDLYAGIGYFTLPYLIYAKANHVHACEWNPDAVVALKNNLAINGVSDRCTVHEGDNRQLKLSNVADRVNLGLIPSSEDGWPVAVLVLKHKGGVLHIHANVTSKTKVKDHCLEKNESDIFPKDSHSESSQLSADDIHKNGDNSQCDTGSTECLCSLSDVSTENSGLIKVVEEEDSYTVWAEIVSRRIECLLMEQKGGKWQCEILHIEKVKSYAPHIDHVVLDLKCQPV